MRPSSPTRSSHRREGASHLCCRSSCRVGTWTGGDAWRSWRARPPGEPRARWSRSVGRSAIRMVAFCPRSGVGTGGVSYLDAERAYRDATSDRYDSWFSDYEEARERDVLARLLPSHAGRLLDLGCGTERLGD